MDEIVQALSDIHRALDKSKYIRGKLGKPHGTSGNPFTVPGKDGEVWVRIQRNSEESLTTALNLGVPLIRHLPILLERDDTRGNYTIVGPDPSALDFFTTNQHTGVSVAPHDHSLGQGLDDYVESMRFLPGLVHMSSGMTVKVEPFFYILNGTTVYFEGGEISLTADVPSTAASICWSKVYLNTTTGVLASTKGTDIPNVSTLEPGSLAAISVSGIPLAGIKLATSQTTINDLRKFSDCRPWFSFGAATSYTPFVGDSGSGGVQGLVPAPAAGDAAALKYLKADGTWALAVPSFSAQTANTFLSGPTSGSPATPTFRGIVSTDILTALTTPPPIGQTTPGTGRFTNLRGDDLKVNTASLDAAAIAQFDSTTKGVLIPRMTTTQRDAIASPPDGLILYNTTTYKYTVRENGVWSEMGAGGSGHIIQDNGSSLTARSKLNFIGATVADNSGADSTDITIAGSGGVATKKTLQTRTVLYDDTLAAPGSWDISGIDQTYDHLEIVLIARSAASGTGSEPTYIYFNNDTTNGNYVSSFLYSSNPTGASGSTATGPNLADLPQDGTPSGRFALVHAFIAAYTDTTRQKLTQITNNVEFSDTVGYSELNAGTWKNTAAINRIEITSAAGYVTGSRLQIIGIKTEDVVTDVSAIVATTKEFQQRTVLYDNTLVANGVWDVSGIDQTYDDLEIAVDIITSDSAQTVTEITFNNDTTDANYTSILHEGSSGGTAGYVFTSSRRFYGVNAQDATTRLSPGLFRIPRYTGTTFHKTLHGISLNEGPAKYVDNIGVIWASAAAINRIKITSYSGVNLAAGSRLRIIGVKAEQVVTDVQGAFISSTNIANQNVAIIQDQKASGADGGTFTSGAWQTRTLNTIANNMGAPVSLSSNQITLPAGTYRIYASAPVYYVNRHQARLRNITDSTTTLVGTGEYSEASGDGTVTRSIINGVFTITSSKVFEIQHYCQTTNTSDGFGLAQSTGEIEIYASIEIERLDTPTISLDLPALPNPTVQPTFTWVNQGTATSQLGTNYTTIRAVGRDASADDVKMLVKSIPTAPYVVTAYLKGHIFSKDYLAYGMCLRDSGSGKIIGLNTHYAGGFEVIIARYNSPSSFSASGGSYLIPDQYEWFRIEDNGTNRIFKVSRDGIEWITLLTESNTTFMTPDQVGFATEAINASGTQMDTAVSLWYWDES
jgi:hypothetical protein